MSTFPYPGLRPFRRDETDIFFGREEQVDQLLERLAHRRFVAVVGPSGCGKSSLVKAGLIPGLETGFVAAAGTRWRVAEMRPGNQPLRTLAEALLDQSALAAERGSDPDAVGFLYAMLRRGPLGLVEALHETPLPEKTNLLVLVDQFEEIFRYRERGSRDEAEAFVSLLLTTVEARDVPAYVVLTMRSDFLGDCALFTGLPETLNEAQFLTPRLTREQRREAIVGPAQVYGDRVEPALVNQLLNDMGADPDQLPLMQHVLMRMWVRAKEQQSHEVQRRVEKTGAAESDAPEGAGGAVLALADYREVGGIDKALSNHADKAFDELDADQKRIAKILFKCLAERGADKRDTRRPVSVREVASVAGIAWEQVVRVLEVFRRPSRSFITPPVGVELTPDTILDIGHESLIRQWEQMNQWVEQETESAATYAHLAESAQLWKKDRGDLLGRLALENFLAWKEREKPSSAWAKRYGGDFSLAMEFLSASAKKRDEERREEEKKQQAELRRVRRTLAWALAGLVLALTLAGYAYWERTNAEKAQGMAENALLAVDIARKEALAAKAAAEAQRGLAEEQANIANVSRNRAELEKKKANEQALLADAARARAEEEGRRAEQERGRAEQQARAAERAKNEAEAERHRAEQQAELARLRAAEALRAKTESFSRELAAASRANLPKDPELSLLLALHAASAGKSASSIIPPYVEDALRQALQASRARLTFHANLGGVRDLAMSPDGRYLATGGGNSVARLWNTASGQEVRAFYGHTDAIEAVAFDPAGERLVTGSEDGTAMVWNLESGEAELVLGLHLDAVQDVAFSPDGRHVATASKDGNAILWDASSGQMVRRLSGHIGPVYALAYSLDGKRLVTGGKDRKVIFWDTESGRPGLSLPTHSYEISAIALSPDGNALATATYRSGVVRIWDAHSGKLLKLLTGHTNAVFDVVYKHNGRRLATASYDGTVKVWDVDSGEVLYALAGHDPFVSSVAYSPDGKVLATANLTSHSTVRLWSTTAEGEWHTHRGPVLSVVVHPSSPVLATAGADGIVRLWHRDTGELLRILAGHSETINEVAFSPDGARIATASADETAVVWNAESGEKLLTLDGHSQALQGIAFSPDGQRLATASRDGTAKLWNALTGQEMITFSGHSGPIYHVGFSPDGKMLATASGDSTVKLWNVSDAGLVRTFTGHVISVRDVAFSPDGKLLATCSNDKSVRLWDVESGQSVTTLLGHTDSVVAVAFSPDGKELASSSEDGVIIWDVSSGRQVKVVQSDSQEITDLAFSPDAEVLTTAGSDGMVRTYVLETSLLVELARSRVTRPLTTKECEQFLHTEQCPPTTRGLIWRGIELAQQPDLKNATMAFRKALELEPSLGLDPDQETKKWAGRKALHIAQGSLRNTFQERDKEAELDTAYKLLATSRLLDPGIKLDPDSFFEALTGAGLIVRGRDLAREGDVNRAAELFQMAASLDYRIAFEPFQAARQLAAQQRLWEGLKLIEDGDKAKGVESLQAAVLLNPRQGVAREAIGRAYFDMGRCEEATEHLKVAVKVSASPDSHAMIADCYTQQKRVPEALSLLNEALRLNPYHSHANLTLGMIRAEAEDYIGAVAALKKVNKDERQYYLPALMTLGPIYFDNLFDYEGAYEAFHTLVDLYPRDTTLMANFAEATLASGRYQRAADLAESVLSRGDSQGFYDLLAAPAAGPAESDQGSNTSTNHPTRKLAMRYIIFSSLILLGETDRAHDALHELINYYNSVPDQSAELGWSYAGTKHFLEHAALDGARRELLFQVASLLENPRSGVTVHEFDAYLVPAK